MTILLLDSLSIHLWF